MLEFVRNRVHVASLSFFSKATFGPARLDTIR